MPQIFVVLVLTALLIVYWKDLKEALTNLNNRRPPGPTGPLPSTDTILLLKGWRKKSTAL